MDLFFIILFCLILWPQKSQSQSFCSPRHQNIVKICTDQNVTNTNAIYIDTISVQHFPMGSCECVITPVRENVHLNLLLYNDSGRNNIQFEINDINVGKFHENGKTYITKSTRLSFTIDKTGRFEICLAVYSDYRANFNFYCTDITSKTTTQTSTLTIYERSKTTAISSSTRLRKETTTIQTTRTSTVHESKAVKTSTVSTILTTIQTRTNSLSSSTAIDTSSGLPTSSATVQDSTVSVKQGISTLDGSNFNVSCTRQTSETTIHSSPASISQGVDTTSRTSLSPTQFSIKSSTGKDSKLSAVIVPSVSATGGFIFGIVIVVSCTLLYKRKRKGNINSTTTRSTSATVEGDYYMTENPIYNVDQIAINESENNEGENNQHYATISPSHNDLLRKSTNRKLFSEDSADGTNNKATLDVKGDQPVFSNAEGEDEAEYDSAKEKFEQGANEHNDYNHLSSIV